MLKLKFLLSVLALHLLLVSSTDAQEMKNPFAKGAWELSIVGGYSSIDSQTDYSSNGYNNHYSSSSKIFSLSAMTGYYVYDGISVEPELQMTLIKDEEPAYSVIVGAAYTYFVSKNNIGIFLKGGVGLSNSITALSISPYLVRIKSGFDVKIYKFSTGLKILVSDDVIIRTELEYKSSSYEESSKYSKTDNTFSEFIVKFGFSVLL